VISTIKKEQNHRSEEARPRSWLKHHLKGAALALGLGALSVFISSDSGLTDSKAKTASHATTGTLCRDEECLGRTLNYIIVTRPMFVDSLKDFAEWKAGIGFDSAILTVDWTDKNYTGALLADKIKAAIHNLRSDGDTFALLVGDTQVNQQLAEGIASPGAHLQMNSLESPWNVPSGYYYRNLPGERYRSEEYTDVFFADPHDWDPEKDGLNDAVDSATPNGTDFIFVGRWPVRTVNEVSAISKKTIQGAMVAEKGGFERKLVALSDASLQENDIIPSECNENANFREDKLTWAIKINCETGIIGAKRATQEAGFAFEFHSFKVDSENKFSDKDSEAFTSLFLGAKTMMLEHFHGGHSVLSAPLKPGSNTIGLSNSQFTGVMPLMQMLSCSVGTFYVSGNPNPDNPAQYNSIFDDSFNEALIKKVPGPIIVVSPEFTYAFYLKMATGASVGDAFYSSKTIESSLLAQWKQKIADFKPEDGSMSWLGSGNGITLQGSDNLLGDPSLVLYPK